MRRVILALGVVVLSLGGAQAQHSQHGVERGVLAAEEAEESRGLESIGEEAEEVRTDDEAGVGTSDDGPAGGMGTVEDEMVDAADADGCTGEIGATTCPGGDN